MDEDATTAKPSPSEQVSRLYEDLEAQAAKASEELVGGLGFAGLLARAAENAAALSKLSADALDIMLRNLRIAGRRDVVSLSRQLARTEDKLERVLQEVEELRDELGQAEAGGGRAAASGKATEARGGRAVSRGTKKASTSSGRAGSDGRASPDVRAPKAPARPRKDSS